MMQIPKYLPGAALLSFVLLATGDIGAANPPQSTAAAAQPAVFATVGESVITQDEYNAAFNTATRAKFYHGKPPDSEIAVLQREVGDKLVARILLEREAKRRGIRADDAEIQKIVQTYDKRYAGSEQWKQNKAKLLPPLLLRLEQDNQLSQLEQIVRTSVKPSQSQVKAYYAAHQDKFTEPEQLRVSVILLKVDPSAPSATWKKTEELAQAIAKRARGGEDFAALARQHSADESAKQGGDMGYLHIGMLPDGTQAALAKLKAGEITDSLRLLQGQAIFLLSDRKIAKLHDFERVKVRAQELAQREQGERAWTAFVADLKAKTPAKIDQSRYLPLAEKSKQPNTPK